MFLLYLAHFKLVMMIFMGSKGRFRPITSTHALAREGPSSRRLNYLFFGSIHATIFWVGNGPRLKPLPG